MRPKKIKFADLSIEKMLQELKEDPFLARILAPDTDFNLHRDWYIEAVTADAKRYEYKLTAKGQDSFIPAGSKEFKDIPYLAHRIGNYVVTGGPIPEQAAVFFEQLIFNERVNPPVEGIVQSGFYSDGYVPPPYLMNEGTYSRACNPSDVYQVKTKIKESMTYLFHAGVLYQKYGSTTITHQSSEPEGNSPSKILFIHSQERYSNNRKVEPVDITMVASALVMYSYGYSPSGKGSVVFTCPPGQRYNLQMVYTFLLLDYFDQVFNPQDGDSIDKALKLLAYFYSHCGFAPLTSEQFQWAIRDAKKLHCHEQTLKVEERKRRGNLPEWAEIEAAIHPIAYSSVVEGKPFPQSLIAIDFAQRPHEYIDALADAVEKESHSNLEAIDGSLGEDQVDHQHFLFFATKLSQAIKTAAKEIIVAEAKDEQKGQGKNESITQLEKLYSVLLVLRYVYFQSRYPDKFHARLKEIFSYDPDRVGAFPLRDPQYEKNLNDRFEYAIKSLETALGAAGGLLEKGKEFQAQARQRVSGFLRNCQERSEKNFLQEFPSAILSKQESEKDESKEQEDKLKKDTHQSSSSDIESTNQHLKQRETSEVMSQPREEDNGLLKMETPPLLSGNFKAGALMVLAPWLGENLVLPITMTQNVDWSCLSGSGRLFWDMLLISAIAMAVMVEFEKWFINSVKDQMPTNSIPASGLARHSKPVILIGLFLLSAAIAHLSFSESSASLSAIQVDEVAMSIGITTTVLLIAVKMIIGYFQEECGPRVPTLSTTAPSSPLFSIAVFLMPVAGAMGADILIAPLLAKSSEEWLSLTLPWNHMIAVTLGTLVGTLVCVLGRNLTSIAPTLRYCGSCWSSSTAKNDPGRFVDDYSGHQHLPSTSQ